MFRAKQRSWYKIRNKNDWAQFRKERKKLEKEIKKARRTKKKLSRLDEKGSKIVNSYVRSKMKVRDQIRALKGDGGKLIVDKE